MANGPTLPPQAYTREILTAAFNWLQSQPESVRKLATTPDALVGLYMRAQRYGNSTLETDAPVSSQNFMSDLKSLAEGLKQFEQPPNHHQPSSNVSHGYQPMQAPLTQFQQPHHPPPPQQAAQPQHAHSHSPMPPMTTAMAAQLTSQMQAQIPLQTPQAIPTTASFRAPMATLNQQQLPALGVTGQNLALNEMSVRMIQEVKSHLNLSSDAEAINMMLALAYKNLKNLLG